MTLLPKIFRVRQTFEAPRVEDAAAEVHRQLARLDLKTAVRPGQTVAITAGSRGIANIAAILRASVDHLRALGLVPFLAPAMGSHGGGTAVGQLGVLASYGITEAAVGCPIRSSMETVVVGHTPEGVPVHFDRVAFEADHCVVCGRVKPHTLFAGEIQSGLTKMLLIGLGKCEGADAYHRAIEDASFDQVARSAAAIVLGKCRILAGVAIVENAYEQTARIEAVVPGDFEAADKRLLVLARQWMARLPFPLVDVLVIDRIGKNISGVGFDANVVGRKFNDHKAVEGESPRVKRICVRGLAPETKGNANGLGMAEFCRSQILDQMDVQATRLNALTAGHVAAAMIPLDYATDREMLQTALRSAGAGDPVRAKLLWIADTLHLTEVACSEAYLAEARACGSLEILDAPAELAFDAAGNLVSF